MPSAKPVVSLVRLRAGSLSGQPAALHQQDLPRLCYSSPPGALNGSRSALMRAFLEKHGCMAGDGIFLPKRWCASRSGITFFGRNNFAYAKGTGSFTALFSFAVDKELNHNASSGEPPCPPGCARCVRACSSALGPFRLYPRKGLAFNAWRTQNGLPHCSASLGNRPLMETRVHGCDLCKKACPRNGTKLRSAFPEAPLFELITRDFILPAHAEHDRRIL